MKFLFILCDMLAIIFICMFSYFHVLYLLLLCFSYLWCILTDVLCYGKRECSLRNVSLPVEPGVFKIAIIYDYK